MISESLRNKLKGISLRIDPLARTSNSFLGEDLNIPLLALMISSSLKYYSNEIRLSEVQIILGNIFLRKYLLNKFIAQALANSPHLCEKAMEAIVFLEAAGLVEVIDEADRVMKSTPKGVSFLKSAHKDNPTLNRKLRLIIISLKKEGLAFS
jgi:hypothetical protein